MVTLVVVGNVTAHLVYPKLQLTNAFLHLGRVPRLHDGAVGVPVRISPTLEEEPVGAFVLGVFDAVPQPDAGCNRWWRTGAR